MPNEIQSSNVKDVLLIASRTSLEFDIRFDIWILKFDI